MNITLEMIENYRFIAFFYGVCFLIFLYFKKGTIEKMELNPLMINSMFLILPFLISTMGSLLDIQGNTLFSFISVITIFSPVLGGFLISLWIVENIAKSRKTDKPS